MATDRRTRAVALPLAIVLVGGVGLWAWAASRPLSAEQRREAARELVEGISFSATLSASSLEATQAIADFGLEEGIRMVPVRIVEELTIEVRFETDRDVLLVGPPRVCLVGPFWNPLDAGLSDRCWGEPDLGTLLADRLPTDTAGRTALQAGQSFLVEATLHRGDVRCDYAPGEWRLQVDAELVIEGVAEPRLDLADVPVVLPLEEGGSLAYRHNTGTRFCSNTAAVYNRQGVPPIEPAE